MKKVLLLSAVLLISIFIFCSNYVVIPEEQSNFCKLITLKDGVATLKLSKDIKDISFYLFYYNIFQDMAAFTPTQFYSIKNNEIILDTKQFDFPYLFVIVKKYIDLNNKLHIVDDIDESSYTEPFFYKINNPD